MENKIAMKRIGVPKEVKNNEYRVGLTPASVHEYTAQGHEVVVEKGAGLGSAITDEDFIHAGAKILDTAEEVWKTSDMIVKVKEPLESEYDLMQEGQTIYTYFHLAAVPALAEVLLKKKITAVAYETIQLDDGRLPLLEPMSEVAGRMSIQVGAHALERSQGGMGILLGGVPGVKPAHVVIIGAGTVGTNAAKMAVGMGARVTILDRSLARLRYLDDIFGSRITTLHSNPETISLCLRDAELVVGAVLIPGAKAPHLVTKSHIEKMKDGSVVVDVSVDQGGCIETAKPTTHEQPTYVIDGVVHYCVANMPGAVARTSTYALNNTTLMYGLKVAKSGVLAAKEDHVLALGVNTYQGKVTHQAVAESLDYEYVELSTLLA